MAFPKHPKAVVTGGGSGLGREICLWLAGRKASILVADVNVKGAEETAAMVRDRGGEAKVTRCDVSVADEVKALADEAKRLFGKIDIVVNNAGVAAGGAVGDIPLEDWQWIVSINLFGPIHGCHYFVPMLKAQGRGWILNVASAAGIASAPEMASYNVTKAGVVSLSETLYGELAKHKIGVSVLCPTFFKTNLLETMRAPETRQVKLAQAFFDRAKITAAEVAKQAMEGLEKGQLYVIPQADGKLVWRLKRLNPQFYFNQVAKQYAGGIIEKLLR